MSTSASILRTINAVKSTQGSKAKHAIVSDVYETIPELKTFVKCVYSRENLYQTAIDIQLAKPVPLWGTPIPKNRNWYEAYYWFLNGERRGGDGEQRLSEAYHSCISSDDQELLKYVVQGDLKCGIGEKGWNKLLGADTIFIPPYQRCSKLVDNNHQKWEGDIVCQTKEDAQFVNIVICESGVEFYSRNWNQIDCDITRKFSTQYFEYGNNYPSQVVLMGEIYCVDEAGNRFGREKSNGLVNGIIQTGEKADELAGFDIVLWDHVPQHDFITGSCDIEYKDRLHELGNWLSEVVEDGKCGDAITFSEVATFYCNSMENVATLYQDVLKNGGEGVVIKNLHGVWGHSDGHKDLVKIKPPMVVRMKVVGVNEADPTSRHANTFASLQMESEDGRVVSAMSGMSDTIRSKINNDREAYMGAIIECKCNGIQRNPEEPHSLYYLNYLRERDDVDTAHTLEDIEGILDSAIQAIAMV